MSALRSLHDYEDFIYSLRQNFPFIQTSSLIVIRHGKKMALLTGDLTFAQGYRLVAREKLNLENESVYIQHYGYELWHLDKKIAWYDDQPHPDDPALADPHPHHKHVPPDIKHNRIPAPNMRFDQPNLPALLAEIKDLITKHKSL